MINVLIVVIVALLLVLSNYIVIATQVKKEAKGIEQRNIKLREKNRVLISDIKTLVEQPDSFHALHVSAKWSMVFDKERALTFGKFKKQEK